MKDNTFFKPTALYKEFMILDLIEKNKNITQREIAKEIGVAVSLVNNYLDEYESKGFIRRKHFSTKTIEYFVTKKGTERRKVLNIGYLNNSLVVFKSASEGIVKFLNQIIEKGFKKILLYGAGDVAEILLQTLNTENDFVIEVIGVIDDDVNKQITNLNGFPILSIDMIKSIEHDGILSKKYSVFST